MKKLIILIISLFLISCDNNEKMIDIGNDIIDKIENYKKEYNKLPSNLEQLELKNLNSSFHYEKNDGKYVLWFGTTVGESMYYYSDLKKWDYKLRRLSK
ncbi:hypothetical protein [Mesonia sp. K4-1]|uniref:hypothetical protein n=1 Tax=Mesonia sp. K4-1 TaxID=2602760 RepID=UPI0011C826ED|nr:hypothetical protein [Mesonia sp. K4-1]TXK74423.1 hypothetical protein FT986_11555 [Mesonia sp. K4-1]